MALTTQNYILNLVPGLGSPPTVTVSQYDVSRTIRFTLYDQNGLYTIPTGTTIRVVGSKPNKGGFTKSCSFSGSTVSYTPNTAMTDVAGTCFAELRLTDSSDNVLGSANFIWYVEYSPIDDKSIKPTELSLVEQLIREFDKKIEEVSTADLLSRINDVRQEVQAARVDADGNTNASLKDAIFKYEQEIVNARRDADGNTNASLKDAIFKYEQEIVQARRDADGNTNTSLYNAIYKYEQEIVNARRDADGVTNTSLGAAIRKYEGEVKAARTGFDGRTYSSLGEMIRNNDKKLQDQITPLNDEVKDARKDPRDKNYESLGAVLRYYESEILNAMTGFDRETAFIVDDEGNPLITKDTEHILASSSKKYKSLQDAINIPLLDHEQRITKLESGIVDVETDIRTEISDLETEISDLETEISDLETDVRTEISDLETDVRTEISDLETDIRTEISDLETDVRTEISDLETDINGKIDDIHEEMVKETTITVGTGKMFSALVEAIHSITDSSKTNRYLVEIYPGTYDTIDIASIGEDGYFGLKIPDYVSLVGMGNRDDIILLADRDDVGSYYDFISVLVFSGNGYVENVTIRSNGVKCCVFDDISSIGYLLTSSSDNIVTSASEKLVIRDRHSSSYESVEHAKHEYRYVKFVGINSDCVIVGTEIDKDVTFRNCNFSVSNDYGKKGIIANSTPVTNQLRGMRIDVHNCKFTGSTYCMELTSKGSGLDNYINLLGNKLTGRVLMNSDSGITTNEMKVRGYANTGFSYAQGGGLAGIDISADIEV